MTTEPSRWDEDISRTYLDLADVAIPGRREQIDVLLSLIPVVASGFTVVDVCCGDGTISEAVLDRFPAAHVIGLDGSETMREQARQRLSGFGERVEVREFDLPQFGWIDGLPPQVRCVISSIAIHHLDDEEKRGLFGKIVPRVETGGAFLIADIVAPASDLVLKSHREFWGRAAREQSLALTGSESLYQRAVSEGWGYYDDAEHDEMDKPSRLYDQLKWLEEAGLGDVDCFWLRGGFAIYGGYK